jgi:hypothetical protein
MLYSILGFALLHLGLPTHAYTCEWYAQSVESVYQCGPKGYPLNYAKKYCERIGAIESLSAEGRAWYHATRECLQQALVPVLADPLKDCNELRHYAFRTHLECYTRNGVVSVCDLPSSDVAQVARALDFQTLISRKSLGLMLGIARECRRLRRSFALPETIR